MKLKSGFRPQVVTAAFVAVMLSLFLLAVGSGGYTSITHFKAVLFLGLCGVYVVFLAVALVLSPPKIRLSAGQKAVALLMLLFLLFSALSAFLSPYFPQTLLGFHRREGLLTLAGYLLCFFGPALFGKSRPFLVALFGATVTIFCLLCVVQFWGYNPFRLYPEGLNYYDGNGAYRYEFLGTIGNVGLVGALLSVAAPVFAVAMARGKGRARFLLVLPLALVWLVTIRMGVAAAIVAVFGGTMLLLPLAMVKNPRFRRIIALLLIVAVLLGMVFVFCFDLGGGTLHEFHALLHGEWDDDFGTGRLFIWRECAALVPEHPLFGGGCDTLGQRETAEFQRYDEAEHKTYRAAIDAAHNEYLNILVNEGALALGAYLAALAVSFVLFIKKAPNNGDVALWGSGVLGYCIQAFFGIRVCITAPLLFLCWGLMFSAMGEDESIKS